MRTATLIVTGSLFALVVALLIGSMVLRGEVERLGRDTAGIRLQTEGAQVDSGSVLRESVKAAMSADERIRTSFIDPNNVSGVLDVIERSGRDLGVLTDIRSVNKTANAVTVAITLEGSKDSIVAMIKSLQQLPVFELTNFYLSFSTSGQKSSWGASLTLTFPTP